MTRLLAPQRQGHIVRLVNRRGIVSVTELARRLETSLMTIRRDVALLDARGVLRRTHGGAVALAAPPDVPLHRRERLELHAKAAIGCAAARLVQPGETVLLDAGTTVLAMAKRLAGVPDLTIVTNSVHVLAALWNRPGIRVLVLGGLVRSSSGSITGPLAEETLKEIRLDRAFLGTTGVTPRWEVSNSDLDLAVLQRKILFAARETYLLADHTKLGRTGLAVVGPLRAFRAVVTDALASPHMLSRLRRQVGKVIVAPVASPGALRAPPSMKRVRK